MQCNDSSGGSARTILTAHYLTWLSQYERTVVTGNAKLQHLHDIDHNNIESRDRRACSSHDDVRT